MEIPEKHFSFFELFHQCLILFMQLYNNWHIADTTTMDLCVAKSTSMEVCCVLMEFTIEQFNIYKGAPTDKTKRLYLMPIKIFNW